MADEQHSGAEAPASSPSIEEHVEALGRRWKAIFDREQTRFANVGGEAWWQWPEPRWPDEQRDYTQSVAEDFQQAVEAMRLDTQHRAREGSETRTPVHDAGYYQDLATFTQLVQRHDLTHMDSDDLGVRQRGRDSLAQIQALAQRLPDYDVRRLWDDMVDRTLTAGHRTGFYWREPHRDVAGRIAAQAETLRAQGKGLERAAQEDKGYGR